MYNNIDIDHTITAILKWLCDLDNNGLLPDGFIIRKNIFEFGDCYFLQLIGTAMSTSAAVMCWATIYFAVRKKHTILPNHSGNLLYQKRYIDDILEYGQATQQPIGLLFVTMLTTMEYVMLTWDIADNKPSFLVDLLDLSITIHGSKIVTKTFQKKMNLYLYILLLSAHSTGCIKGTVYGLT